jgi:hypothetical protein
VHRPTLLAILILAFSSAAQAQEKAAELPLPPAVAERLGAAKEKLGRRYLALEEEKRQLKADGTGVEKGSPKEQSLLQRKQAILARMATYKVDLEAYEADKALELKIAATRKAIEHVAGRLEEYQASLDEWTELAQDARSKAREAAKKAAATVLLVKLESRVEARQAKEVPLREDALARIRGLMDRKVLGEPHYSSLPGLRDRTVEKLASLRSDADAVALLKLVKGGLDSIPEGLGREELFSALLGLIGLVSRDPAIELLIADGELAIADVYLRKAVGKAAERIDQLVDLGDAQLRELKSLSDLYKEELQQRRTLAGARVGEEK